MIEFLVVFTIALIVSLISGVLGLGGAVILIPAYLYFPKLFDIHSLDVKTITGLTSIQVFASSLLGVIIHKKRGSVGKELLYVIGFPMASSALIGAVLSDFVDSEVILFVFAVMALIGGLFMFSRVSKERDELNLVDVQFNKKLALIIAILVGLFGGMVGAPGAFILAPLMISVLKIPIRVTIGSTLGIVLITAFTASIGKIIAGQVNYLLTSYAVLGSIIGVTIGSNLSYKFTPRFLRIGLALVILGIAIEMIINVLN